MGIPGHSNQYGSFSGTHQISGSDVHFAFLAANFASSELFTDHPCDESCCHYGRAQTVDLACFGRMDIGSSDLSSVFGALHNSHTFAMPSHTQCTATLTVIHDGIPNEEAARIMMPMQNNLCDIFDLH